MSLLLCGVWTIFLSLGSDLGYGGQNLFHRATFQKLSNRSMDFEGSLVRLKNPENQKNCSGAFISDYAHVLTAAHCVEGCKKVGGGRCLMRINGKDAHVHLVYVPSCRTSEIINAYSKSRKSTRLTEKEKRCAGESDIAIIQPVQKDKPRNFKCLKTEAAMTDLHYAVGVPSRTSRPRSGNADGKNWMISKGNLVRQKRCRQVSSGETFELDLDRSTATSVQTSVDLFYGSSGGPILTEHGKLAGIAAGIYPEKSGALAHHKYDECPGSTRIEPFGPLLDKLNPYIKIQLRCRRVPIPPEEIRGIGI